ncbi:MAG: hypothetical protein GF350_03575 [Chitinivibrionales bacterium]|nr:hypothetical protein [Chitinivibrionales bacterium]
MPQKKKNPHIPHIRLVHRIENEWEFECPGLSQVEYERFYDLVDLCNSGTKGNITKTERGYRQLVKESPEFLDVYHSLAMLLDETDREAEAFQLARRA